MSTIAGYTLVVAALVSHVWLEFACATNNLALIENRLRDQVDSLDLGTNIAELKLYANEVEMKPNEVTSELVDAIQKLVKASEMCESPKCDKQEFELLNSLDILLYGNKPMETSRKSGDSLDRIEIVFSKILARHIEQCEQIHREKVYEAIRQVDITVRSRLDLLLDRVVRRTYGKGSGSIFDCVQSISRVDGILRMDSLLNSEPLNAVNDVIMGSINQETIDLIRENGNEAERLLNEKLSKHILDGCEKLVDSLSEVGRVGSLDLVLKPREFNLEQRNYYRVLCLNHLCRLALKQRAELAKALVSLL